MKTNSNQPKVYLNKINENWIVDRLRSEWYSNNPSTSTKNIYRSELVWLIASWSWQNVKPRQLAKRKVLCSVHHIDEDKFDKSESNRFFERDKYVDEYHVVSQKTASQVAKLTKKKITSIPFWVNTNIWFEISEKRILKEKYKFHKNDYLIGSFQRDSEGHDLKQPKLSKGPDRFIEILLDMKKINKNLHVVLTGLRRDYIVNQLVKNNIKYSYFKMVDFEAMNELYNCLDLYIVSSRYEGGPQAILECGVTRTPIISTDVGVAAEILSSESIFDMNNFHKALPNIEYAYSNSIKYEMKNIFKLYRKMMMGIYEN
jgi:glycosyltransferase involved in cell wall biosynthesis|tara:strand:- start:2590 stop:3534 length:945 start_codon:yes stop_codon:yes gene_type:complete